MSELVVKSVITIFAVFVAVTLLVGCSRRNPVWAGAVTPCCGQDLVLLGIEPPEEREAARCLGCGCSAEETCRLRGLAQGVVHLAHEAVKVDALLAFQREPVVEKIHQPGLAAPHAAPEVKPPQRRASGAATRTIPTPS